MAGSLVWARTHPNFQPTRKIKGLVEQTTRSIDHSISKRQASLEASSGWCGAVQRASPTQQPQAISRRRPAPLPRLCEARRHSRRCGRGKGATEQVLLMQEQMTWAKYWQASLMSYWSGGPCKLGALFNRTGCTPMGTGLCMRCRCLSHPLE